MCVCLQHIPYPLSVYSVAVLAVSYSHIADLIPLYKTANTCEFGCISVYAEMHDCPDSYHSFCMTKISI